MSEASAPATELGLPMLFGPRPRPKRDIPCPDTTCGRLFSSAGALASHLRRSGHGGYVYNGARTRCRPDVDEECDPEARLQRQRQKRADYVRRKRSMLPCIHRDSLRGLTLRSPLLQCAALCLEPIHFTESLAPWEDPISAGDWIALVCSDELLEDSLLSEKNASVLDYITHLPWHCVVGLARVGAVSNVDNAHPSLTMTCDQFFIFEMPVEVDWYGAEDIVWAFSRSSKETYQEVKHQASKFSYQPLYSADDDSDGGEADTEGAALMMERIWSEWIKCNSTDC